MDAIVGKTISKFEFKDAWDNGLLIVFTDGTELRVSEVMQAGEIKVTVNGQEIDSQED